ncbi:BTB/POZ domain-containing protein 19, partial [Linnemannia exigua]
MPVYSNPDALGADFLRLVNSPVGADVRLIIGEEKVMMHGHALILQTRSTYFARALTTDWKEANQGNIIHKPNIRPAIFLQILSFLYTGRLELDETTVMDLIRAADELLLDDLLFGCERFALTTLCRGNVLEMVELAGRHNLAQLKTECLDFIASNIDYLKRGKGIVKVEVEILKDILSMDQLDLDELEIWKIAVRWAYFQQGLEWETCPLVDFPKGTGCILVQPVPDKEEEGEGEEGNADISIGSSQYRDQQKQLFGKASTGTGNNNININGNGSGSDDEMTDARVPLGGTTVHLSRHDPQDEDGFRQSSHSVFQRNIHHKVISLPISVHEELARRILPLLSSIRFLRIPSMDFLRLIEGTGLLPMYLCAKVYRHHSVPSMTDPYQPSLRRRMAFSTILSKDHKEILLEWLQAAIHGAQSGNTGSSMYGWQRSRSATANSVTASTATSPTARNSSVIANSSSSPPSSSSSSSLTSGLALGNSPPAYWPRSISNNSASTSTASHRLSSPAATTTATSGANNTSSALGHRSTRSGSSYSSLTHSGSFTTHPNTHSTTTNSSTFQQQPSSPSLTQTQHQLPQPKLTLQYRASRDGFDAHNFHMSCDQRGPTLTVVRADNGTIFGGYNSSSWSSHPSGVYSTSR